MGDDDQARHRALVLRCQHGDRGAMEALFLRHNQALGYYLRRMLGRDDVSDVQQEVWLAVLRRLHQLRDPEAFVVWLYTIARHRALTRLQERTPMPLDDAELLADPSATDGPEFTAEDAEAIHRELASLSPTHREVIVLRFMESLSYDQIAAVTECSPGTVRSRLHYAKQMLRARLEGCHERI